MAPPGGRPSSPPSRPSAPATSAPSTSRARTRSATPSTTPRRWPASSPGTPGAPATPTAPTRSRSRNRDGHPGLTTVVHMGEEPTPDGMLSYETLVDGATAIDDARRGGDEIAGLFYTGGTTGFPKGVMLTHANLLTSALGSQATTPIVIPGGQLLHAAPMFHLADLAAWTAQSMVGGTHVIVPMFEPKAVLTA